MTTQTASPVQARLDELVDGEGRPALVGYLPVGYPSVPGSADAVRAMVDAGVDVVELGMQYTDPVMDGPVIQRAVEAALQRGTRVRDTLHVVEQVAGRGAPILVMTYWNLVLRYGVEAYARDLATGERVSLQLRDLLFERGVRIDDEDVLRGVAAEHGVEVDLADRRAVLAEHAEGARRGVTGSPHFFTPGGGFFCPALDVGREPDGRFRVRVDDEGFERFVSSCFGEG